jgi:DNA replication licensing factor MCM2
MTSLVDDIDLAFDSEDQGEDLFGELLQDDYRQNVKLDQYDYNSADELEFAQMDREQRLVAEARMRRRDREEGRATAFLDQGFPSNIDDDLFDERMPIRRRRKDLYDDIDIDDDQVIPLDPDALKDVKGPIGDFVAMEAPRRAIESEFHLFLTSYVSESGESIYGERIKLMCEAESPSLEIDYHHLYQTNATLTYFLVNCPSEILKIFDKVAMDVVLSGFENYEQIHSQVHVRIANLPVQESLRDLRQVNLNTLLRVAGVVTRRSSVFPQLKYVKYDCIKCGALLGPFYQDPSREIKIGKCSNCQSAGPFKINTEQTVYRNYQRITLQETPGSVMAGRLPRSREVVLLWDLVDSVRPGEEIEVTGIYRNNFDASLNVKNGFPVFTTLIEANHVSKKEDKYSSLRLTEEDHRQIRLLAKDDRIRQRVSYLM